MSTMNQTPAPAAAVTHTTLESELGELTILARRGVVIGLYFPHHWYRPDWARLGVRSDVGFEKVRVQLGEYLAGERQTFDVPVAMAGDERQQRVWELVRGIPYSETTTYGDLARQLDDGTTPQAVGAAVGRNPVPVLVPCHRVMAPEAS